MEAGGAALVPGVTGAVSAGQALQELLGDSGHARLGTRAQREEDHQVGASLGIGAGQAAQAGGAPRPSLRLHLPAHQSPSTRCRALSPPPHSLRPRWLQALPSRPVPSRPSQCPGPTAPLPAALPALCLPSAQSLVPPSTLHVTHSTPNPAQPPAPQLFSRNLSVFSG